MIAKEVKLTLHRMGELADEYAKLERTLLETGWFDDLYMKVTGIYPGCSVTEEGLISATGVLLSTDSNCMDKDLPYFFNQRGGCSEDDFYSGTMFFKVDDIGTFVSVEYEC